jgi:hypothetical protein
MMFAVGGASPGLMLRDAACGRPQDEAEDAHSSRMAFMMSEVEVRYSRSLPDGDDLIGACYSEDFRQGVRAFGEKRQAHWTGK